MRDAPTSDSGEPPSAFCPRCNRRSDPAAIGGRVGLCHCVSCGEYACRWCWADAVGACPSCAYAYVVAPVAAATPRGLMAAFLRRFELRRSIAAGALVVVAVILAQTLAGGIRPTGGVEAVTGLPSSSATAGVGSSSPGSPSDSPAETTAGTADPTADVPTTTAAATPIDTGGQSQPTPRPDGSTPAPGPTQRSIQPTPTPPGATPTPRPTPTPDPTPTPAPTATPAPTPTPSPVPTPTPAPTPTPTCKTVPPLLGKTVPAAHAAWTAAGFTGSLTANGTGKKVLTQDPAPGACLPASTTIVVTT